MAGGRFDRFAGWCRQIYRRKRLLPARVYQRGVFGKRQLQHGERIELRAAVIARRALRERLELTAKQRRDDALLARTMQNPVSSRQLALGAVISI